MKTKLISDLIFVDYNPRIIKKANFEKLMQSIKEFGFAEPVVINTYEGRENVIVAGHMRVRAAMQLGMTEVPIFEVSIDPEKEQILNIALNHEAMRGAWDEAKLQEIFVRINEPEKLRVTGFKDEQIVRVRDDGMIHEPKVPEDEPEEKPENMKQVKCPECGFKWSRHDG